MASFYSLMIYVSNVFLQCVDGELKGKFPPPSLSRTHEYSAHAEWKERFGRQRAAHLGTNLYLKVHCCTQRRIMLQKRSCRLTRMPIKVFLVGQTSEGFSCQLLRKPTSHCWVYFPANQRCERGAKWQIEEGGTEPTQTLLTELSAVWVKLQTDGNWLSSKG